MRVTVALLENHSSPDVLLRCLQNLTESEELEVVLLNCSLTDEVSTLLRNQLAGRHQIYSLPGGTLQELRVKAFELSNADYIAFFEEDTEIESYWYQEIKSILPRIQSACLGGILTHVAMPVTVPLMRVIQDSYSRVPELLVGYHLSACQLANGYQNSIFRAETVRNSGLHLLQLDAPHSSAAAERGWRKDEKLKLIYCSGAMVYQTIPKSQLTIESLEDLWYRRGLATALIKRSRTTLPLLDKGYALTMVGLDHLGSRLDALMRREPTLHDRVRSKFWLGRLKAL